MVLVKQPSLRTISGLVRPSAGRVSGTGNEIQEGPCSENRSSWSFSGSRRSPCLSRFDSYGNLRRSALRQIEEENQANEGLFLVFPRLEERKNQMLQLSLVENSRCWRWDGP